MTEKQCRQVPPVIRNNDVLSDFRSLG